MIYCGGVKIVVMRRKKEKIRKRDHHPVSFD